MPQQDRSDDEVLAAMDARYVAMCRDQRQLLFEIAEVDRRGLWQDTEAGCMAHWVSMRYGISGWKAERWVKAARALEDLPAVADALCAGHLGIDQLVELTRLITISDDSSASLLDWGIGRSSGSIRARADEELRWSRERVGDLLADRSLRWGYEDEGRRFIGVLELPAAEGVMFSKAIERQVERMASSARIEARRVDALLMLASSQIAADPDPDRATVLIHARAEQMAQGGSGALEGAGVIDGPTVDRRSCDARVQHVLEDAHGQAVALGRTTRVPSVGMLRQLRYQDRDCAFPGCGYRRFTNAHHIVHWSRGGRTDLANLVLLCTFHHRLVHERGWSLKRESNGVVSWFYPDGYPYWGGPPPPRRARELVGAGP